MKSLSARLALTDSRIRLRPVLLAALLLAATALVSSAAFAASGTFDDCDRLATDLKSLDVPADELPLDDADHIGNRIADAALVDRPRSDIAPNAGDPPVLLLTPRVADIVREVFDTLPVVAIDDGTGGTGAEEDADDVPTHSPATDMPPIVRVPSLPEIAPPAANGSRTGGTQYVPRFQTPMYRTDI